MAHTHRPRGAGQSGQMVIWMAVLLPIALIAVGLAVDVGAMINGRDEFAGAIDAASLAGAQALHDAGTNETYVRNAVKNVARTNQVPSLANTGKSVNPVLDLNTSNAPTGDIVLGKYDYGAKTFTPLGFPVDETQVNAVKVIARLGAAATMLPLAFGKLVGIPSYDTTRTSTAALAGPVSTKPTTPIAIDKNVFTGKTKGFTAPDDILASYKLGNVAFTGFFGGSNASNVATYFANPGSIPQLNVGDVISLAGGAQGGNFNEMESDYKAGDVITVPVCSFDPGTTYGTVTGFAAVRVDLIDGQKKYIDGTLVKLKTGTSSKTTTADCYGLDCRAFLVN